MVTQNVVLRGGLLIACFCMVAAIAVAAPPEGAQASWPQFLGPMRNGSSPVTGLLQAWPDSGPAEVWRTAGGVGMSGLAVSDGRLVTLVQRDGKQWMTVLDATSGKRIHDVPLAPEYLNPMGNGPRATPAISGKTAFAYTGEGILVAVDLESGSVLWKVDTLDDLKGKEAEYGMASSPLLAGDLVIVTPGASGGTVAAYRQKDGSRAWAAVTGGGRDTAGYSSPALYRLAGIEQVVVFNGKAVTGLLPTTGELLWRHNYKTNYDCNIALPVQIDGRLLISSGEDHGSELLEISKSADGYSVQSVWTSFGTDSVLRSEWQTAILHDGNLYGMNNLGGAGPITHLACINAKTGERVWEKTRFGKGNLIYADGKLFLAMMNGDLVIVKATPEKYEELGRMQVSAGTRQSPSLAGGLLYIRDDVEIICIDVRDQTGRKVN